jgi:outer membrane protein TolC
MTPRGLIRALVAWACLVSLGSAQNQPAVVERPQMPIPIRPYMAPTIPPIQLRNTDRLHSLIRAGHLYLTVADALALAIENNLNLEIDRYGPALSQSALERAKAGGPLRGVPSASAQISSVNAGVGVSGSTLSAGLSSGGGGGTTTGTGAASIQQVGAITPNLDPVLQDATTWAHLSQPQANTVVSQTDVLVQSVHVDNTTLQEGLLTGGVVQFRNYYQYLKENAPSDNLNPVTAPHVDLAIQQNFLRGFGIKLNDRNIRIAKLNTTASLEMYRSQLLDLVAQVLNLYWNLVSANDELRARQHALEVAQKFVEDTRKEIGAGAIPRVQLPRAEAEAASRRTDLTIAEANVRQQATLLKEALSHTEDPALEAADIVPLEQIQVPQTDDLPPLRQAVATAMAKRPDVAVAKFRDETTEISLLGTTNPLMPSLQATLQTYDRGVGGTPQIVDGQSPNPYFIGGYGTALGQIFRHNFPNYQATVNFSISVGNRQAQGDYGIDQLTFRQQQVRGQRDMNQIVVDLSSQMSALRQARLRYSAARDTRILQEQLLEAEQKKFTSGLSTFNDLIIDQRAVVTAQISEVTAMATYVRARVSLDQVMGETLEVNHISLAEGLNGRVSRESTLPATIEAPKK